MRHVILDPTKRTFIDACFKHHGRRAERLIEVWEQGHQDDALPELWRASVAYIAYERLRNPFVHQLGGPGAVIVVNETVSEREVSIDFSVLHRGLLNAMDHYESVSRTTGNWFGHDLKP